VIDLGPEGGNKGGEIIAVGTPEEVAAHPTSHTGRYLKQVLDQLSARGLGSKPLLSSRCRLYRALFR
jgi:excinuclease ABC subunit A